MPRLNSSQPNAVTYEFPAPLRFADPARCDNLARAFPVIRRTLQTFAEQQNIPGLGFGIVVDNELAYADALGVRDVAANAPVTRDTVFRIASMSKSFIAMAILRLRDESRLRLDDPVARYVSQFKRFVYPTADSPEITIRHLLTMAPGFPEDNPWGDRQMAISHDEFTRRLRAGIPFSNAPNETFEYSNYGYSILGRIVSRITGMSFQEYVERHILEPLGMAATTWDKSRVPPQHMAQGYRWVQDPVAGSGAYRAEPILDDGAFAAMAGLWTTVPDFARYMAFLLDAFPPRNDPQSGPIERATVRGMQQLVRFEELVERKLPDGRTWHAASGYGFGLAVWHDERFGYGVAHGGGLPGYGSFFYLLPHQGVGIVVLTNKTYSRVSTIFPQVLDLLDETGGLRLRPISPAAVLVKVVGAVNRWLDGGDDAELLQYAADNFLLDREQEQRRAEWRQLCAPLGEVLRVHDLQPLNALRGKWRLDCEGGCVDVLVTLAPTMPPTLQALTLTPVESDSVS